MKKKFLLTPGPTPVPESILLKMASPIIHHRTSQFKEIFKEVNAGLKYLFQTTSDVYTLASSGTGAMEAACVNLVGPGEKALVINSGKFGERFANILKAYGAVVELINVEYGDIVDPSKIKEALDKDKSIKAVFTTLCETSTGIVTDIEEIAKITAKYNAVLVVDAVSGLGACRMEMDKWGIDVVVSGSQKGLMLPPGLAFISMSPKAWKVAEATKGPKFFFDLAKYRKSLAKDDVPFTPAVSLVIGLNEALKMIKEQGIENVWACHDRLAMAVRSAVAALGLKLFAKTPANMVTAVCVPDGIDGQMIVKIMRDEYGVSIAGGQDNMKGKIIRIAHLGYMTDFDMIVGISALEMALKKLGYNFELGAGVRACEKEFMK